LIVVNKHNVKELIAQPKILKGKWMEIYSVDDTGKKLSLSDDVDTTKITPESLSAKISRMDVYAELFIKSKYRCEVHVHNNYGTSQMLASGQNDLNWLKFNSVKAVSNETKTIYHFIFD